MQCKHPLVKRLRKAGASTKSAVRAVSSIQPWLLKSCYKDIGGDIAFLFVWEKQPEGFSYWREINKRMGH